MNQTVTKEKLEKYFSITKEALDKVEIAFDEERIEEAKDFFDMASRYYSDAEFFYKNKEDLVLAFAALNYAHGWLDAGARIGLFKVNDNRLFTVDEE
ncbi:MAG: DUF357 domain-containing protein [Nanoarchaeota archaeon]|nr:DUF357 domain-containing protein [Nanoarchaeota archaeon]MBU1644058.1 DUF357 domain-containing protein [Nanoarchaeota archaeon]MBU1977300.1 DUF357 domain-containing protein [Nanoarchaeota archaeon]